MDLTRKTAVIVNGDISPAPEICRRLAQAGANLVVHYPQGAKRPGYAETLPRANRQHLAFQQASLREQSQVKQLLEEAKASCGTLDVLVYVARPKRNSTLRSLEVQAWLDDVEEDLKGLYRVAREVSKVMAAQKSGKIIPVYFGVGIRGEGELVSWSACSGGISGFIKCLATELIRFQVNVNGVAYGVIDDVDFPFMTKRSLKQFLEYFHIARAGTSADVAGAVHFLASDDSNYITGQNLYVNGGLLL